MNRHEQKLWAAARTLGDLGELTAQWLEGRIKKAPSYDGRPNSETKHLIPVLAAVNRAGFVTDQSQPGHEPQRGFDRQMWTQRAAVDGFATPAVAARFASAAKRAGLLVTMNTAGRFRDDGVVVTMRGDEPCTTFGRRVPKSELEFLFSVCGREVVDAVCSAQQVAIVDPEWGRNDRLWTVLARAAGR